MLKIINKLFPFLSKKHDSPENINKKNLQLWKEPQLLTVNQVSYLYNNLPLSINHHEQYFENLSVNEKEISVKIRVQLLTTKQSLVILDNSSII